MGEFNLQAQFSVKTTTCITCGITIALPKDMYDHRLKNHQDFYCPNGHPQHFIEEAEEVKLRRELEATKRRLEFEQHEKLAARQQLGKANAANVRLKKRIKAGVCPCCHRTFTQLARHMHTKHPGYTP